MKRSRVRGVSAAVLVALVAAGPASAGPRPVLEVVCPDARSLAALDAARRDGANALVSPASLAAVVAMARAGIDGGGTPPDLPGYVAATNAVWLDTDQRLTAAAADRLDAAWGAHTETLSLAASGQDRINGWVAEATGGRIPALIDAPLDDIDIVVTNTLYFKDAWGTPFRADATAPGRFTRADGSTLEVPFMSGPGIFPSWTVGGDSVVALGFAQGGLMLLRLPALPSGPVADLADRHLALAEAIGVRVSLPRIEIGVEADLTALVRAVGLEPDLAEGFATLTESGLTPGPVIQNVTLSIDEAGAEAAAATAALATRSVATEEPPLLVFDRPFDAFIVAPGRPTALIAAAIADPG